ncbi:hypothetical protein MPDQ_001654 [Monascus purpureus]|uniref:Membrane-bound alpha-1,6-mannosyltransferase Initiation-specific n=1 Tax=Monascus purpureus TaxID=5098 RepID=A0A507QNZ4_MONPU|nr:hypothetical protein MPDQ_001654 [Monascus purpureus]
MISNLQGPRGAPVLPKQIMRKALPGFLAFILIVLYLSIASPLDEFNKQDLDYQITQATGLFPRKIWQTWKVDPLNFEERDLNTARTWTSKNPGYRYEVLTDQNDILYVETHFGPHGINRPDIVYVYKTLTAKIIKADLLRYLVMYIEGGVYTDIDVEALKPMERFIPDRYDEHDIDMIIGVEIDEPELHDHPILGQKSESFCQWTFVCKPRLPVMMRLIDNILRWLNSVAERQNRSIADIELDFDEVISGTGPSAFTEAVLAEISKKVGYPVHWDTFHDMPESKLVGGVLVLTVEAFAAGQGHSDSGNHNARTALVKHHYHASGWPSNHPRYSHPMYGEVERCNWNKDCVREWDANTAAFDALPPEEQARQISIKQAMEASAAEMEAAQPPPLEAPAFFPAEFPSELPEFPPAEFPPLPPS